MFCTCANIRLPCANVQIRCMIIWYSTHRKPPQSIERHHICVCMYVCIYIYIQYMYVCIFFSTHLFKRSQVSASLQHISVPVPLGICRPSHIKIVGLGSLGVWHIVGGEDLKQSVLQVIFWRWVWCMGHGGQHSQVMHAKHVIPHHPNHTDVLDKPWGEIPDW